MARKRKIPARKHHGIRDPLKQLEDREKKLKNIVNNPPEKGGDQKVSFKFKQFKKIADEAKSGKKLKRLFSGREDKPRSVERTKGSKKSKHTVKGQEQAGSSRSRNIKQFADEEDEDYLKRVNRITTESLREAEYEVKYGVNVVRNAKTGEISIKKRPKNEIDELLKQKQKPKIVRRGKKEKAPKQPMDAKTAKELIKQAIKEGKEEEKNQENGEIEEYKRDVFKFGEIVHAPPTLSRPRKATKIETVPRPGQKNNLLLKTMLAESSNVPTIPTKTSKSKPKPSTSSKVTKAQLMGKRKDLPAATRTMLENEQSKIIELYRQLKKSKEKQNSF